MDDILIIIHMHLIDGFCKLVSCMIIKYLLTPIINMIETDTNAFSVMSE